MRQITSTTCLIFIQFISCLISLTTPLYSHELSTLQDLSFERLERLQKLSRNPANFIPNLEEDDLPFQGALWIEEIMIEDDAGVLVGMKRTIESWDEAEEYARIWNLEDDGRYQSPTESAKTSYVKKSMLRYIDKRISGEIKRAEKGSGWEQVGKVQTAIAPSSTKQISQNVKLKFRARLLQGMASAKLENPVLETTAELKTNGELKVYSEKKMPTIKAKSRVEYNVSAGRWIASVDKDLSEKVKAQVSSEGPSAIHLLNKTSDQRVQVIYSFGF